MIEISEFEGIAGGQRQRELLLRSDIAEILKLKTEILDEGGEV
jgi:hypothetical protein